MASKDTLEAGERGVIEELEALAGASIPLLEEFGFTTFGCVAQGGHVTALAVCEKGIKEVPPGIGKLAHLKILHLYNNALGPLPESLGQLPALEYLDLNYNQIKVLPASVTQLKKLAYLGLEGNPLRLTKVQKKWMKQLQKSGCGVFMEGFGP